MFYLLVCYFIFLLIFAAYSFSGIYHLWRFGYVGDLTKPAIFIYSFIVLAIIIVTFFFVGLRSWPVSIN